MKRRSNASTFVEKMHILGESSFDISLLKHHNHWWWWSDGCLVIESFFARCLCVVFSVVLSTALIFKMHICISCSLDLYLYLSTWMFDIVSRLLSLLYVFFSLFLFRLRFACSLCAGYVWIWTWPMWVWMPSLQRLFT